MSLWALRGLRDGVVTTRWPRRPDAYAATWRGPAAVRPQAAGPVPPEAALALEDLCPAGAIQVGALTAADRAPSSPGTALAPAEAAHSPGAAPGPGYHIRVDQGRCILCGRCVQERPDVFEWTAGATGPAAAALSRQALVVPDGPETDTAIDAARAALARRTAALRRSVHVRHVDAGSDGSTEWEIQALLGPVYDVARLGIFFTASPRHADVLLVTGAGTPGMAGPLRETYDGMPDPKVVIAAGADAISGGLLGDVRSGVAGYVSVDIWVTGDPPSPFGLLKALLMATGKLK